jgi:hypothetical protein
MTKNDYINIFNNMIRGTPVSWQNKILPMICEYLTEIKLENYDKLINLIVQNPQMCNQYLLDCVSYYCRKHCILSIIFNNKTILYYE